MAITQWYYFLSNAITCITYFSIHISIMHFRFYLIHSALLFYLIALKHCLFQILPDIHKCRYISFVIIAAVLIYKTNTHNYKMRMFGFIHQTIVLLLLLLLSLVFASHFLNSLI